MQGTHRLQMEVKGLEDHPRPRVCCVYVTRKLLLLLICKEIISSETSSLASPGYGVNPEPPELLTSLLLRVAVF